MKQPHYTGRRFTVAALTGAQGLTRQGYYQARQRLELRDERQEKALALVRELRAELPRLGTRKLYHERYEQFRGLNIGRDALFSVLRDEDMLIPRRRRGPRTTDSRHGLRLYRNLLKDPETGTLYRPERANEVFVADITYLETLEGFRYLALLTDAYSRKIVGYDLSASLSIEGSLRALDMALKQTNAAERRGLIHHSDRGVQYCSRAYVDRLEGAATRVSMASRGNCYENALAERVNGILKQELSLGDVFATGAHAQCVVSEAVRLYNERRPHLALAYRKPSQVHAAHRLVA